MKSIDLFLKHQQVKTSCMDELTRLRASRPGELDQAYETLNEQLDKMLKSVDAENIRKRELLVKNVKANAIGKYKTYMKNCVSIFYLVRNVEIYDFNCFQSRF